jgi:hypothetical protein
MHSNDSFAGLIAHAQQLNMLEDRPSAIAARGLSAAMEQGWI